MAKITPSINILCPPLKITALIIPAIMAKNPENSRGHHNPVADDATGVAMESHTPSGVVGDWVGCIHAHPARISISMELLRIFIVIIQFSFKLFIFCL